MRSISRTMIFAALLGTSFWAGAAGAEEWGNLTGKFVYDGTPPAPQPLKIDKDPACCMVKHTDEIFSVDKDGGLANVLIYVRTPKVKVNPSYDAMADGEVVLDNKDCKFHPHILAMRLSQTLVIKDSDNCSHNTNISPLGGGGINPLIGAGQSATYKFPKQQNQPVPIACNIHPWMKAYILPRDNPYFAVSAADGTFKIENLPAGSELEFQVWHEPAFVNTPKWPNGKFKMTIKPGDNDLGTVKLPPTAFKK